MRRDAIFYRLFQQSPSLIFELLEAVPENAERYRFESVAVKETAFVIDGVFLPPQDQPPGVVIFAEVQMQLVQNLYERLFGEAMPYFYRNRELFSDWLAVVIYPSRAIEQRNTYPYRALLNSDQVHRIYLNELGPMEALPLGVAAMVLTIIDQAQAPDKARMLLQRAKQEMADLPRKQGIIDMISTIMVYKFTTLSREEIDAMLGIKLEDTRVFREAGEEKCRSLVSTLLARKVGDLPEPTSIRVKALSPEQVEDLAIALLDFESLDDLSAWLDHQGSGDRPAEL
jgi:predicted transposase/invertase (TIGR01784 family)